MRRSHGTPTKRHQKRSDTTRGRDPRSRKTIQAVLADCQDTSRLFELYYFSQEPAMLDIMRAIAALPEEARAALEAFFTMSHESAAIVAHWDATGRLTLSSPQVGQTMAIMRYCAENEEAEKPLPN
jgi:hypothetical protein